MRRVLPFLGSFASGLLTIFAALVVLVLSLFLFASVALPHGNNGQVAWDVVSLLVSLFGHHWQGVLVGITLAVFGLGSAIGFRVLNRRLAGGH